MRTLEDAFSATHALVIGIGGSGDVVGTIPTARMLEQHDVTVTVGGVAWEPVPQDPQIGPRSLDDFRDLTRVSQHAALVTHETRTTDGIQYSESVVADHLDDPVVLLDITGGADGLIAGLTGVCEALGVDLVIGTDSGGDVLARGDEPGLRSPITDGLALVGLDALALPALIGVFGYGSDGELSLAELNEAIGRAAANDGLMGAWGITPRIRDDLEAILANVTTEASRLPVEAAHGTLGERRIRGGEVPVHVTPSSTVTFYFTIPSVYSISEIAPVVAAERTLPRIRDKLSEMGLVTEFEREAYRKNNLA